MSAFFIHYPCVEDPEVGFGKAAKYKLFAKSANHKATFRSGSKNTALLLVD